MILDFKIPGTYEATDQQKADYAERYAWLKNNESKGNHTRPFVMNPKRSRLYAIAQFIADELDAAIDYDILCNTCDLMHHHGHMVENHLTQGFYWPSDEYCNLLADEAFKLLGWTQERIDRCKAYEKSS